LSVKKITKFNDSFFRIKVYTPNFNHEKFEKIFEKKKKKQYQELNFHIMDVPNGIIRFFFQYLKSKFNIQKILPII